MSNESPKSPISRFRLFNVGSHRFFQILERRNHQIENLYGNYMGQFEIDIDENYRFPVTPSMLREYAKKMEEAAEYIEKRITQGQAQLDEKMKELYKENQNNE